MMRALMASIGLLAVAIYADDFIVPAHTAYVSYGQAVEVKVHILKPVTAGKILFGRTFAEASRIVLKSAISEYGDTVRVTVSMPAFYPSNSPADRDFTGWAQFWLTTHIGEILASVAVQVGEPPASGAGKVFSPMHRPRPGRLTLVNILGRNIEVTPAFTLGR